MAEAAQEQEKPVEGIEGGTMSRGYLVERLGAASGAELFERIDVGLRAGDVVHALTVGAARGALKANIQGHATLVMPGRTGPKRARIVDTDGSMLVISLDDLEAVVKAREPEFAWTTEFAPRSDLPKATRHIQVKSGARARRGLRF